MTHLDPHEPLISLEPYAAYYAGAVPLDQLKHEQPRIQEGVSAAERLLKSSEASLTETRIHLDQALDLVEDCQAAYLAADDTVRGS